MLSINHDDQSQIKSILGLIPIELRINFFIECFSCSGDLVLKLSGRLFHITEPLYFRVALPKFVFTAGIPKFDLEAERVE